MGRVKRSSGSVARSEQLVGSGAEENSSGAGYTEGLNLSNIQEMRFTLNGIVKMK